jgi:hypothetical protein
VVDRGNDPEKAAPKTRDEVTGLSKRPYSVKEWHNALRSGNKDTKRVIARLNTKALEVIDAWGTNEFFH